jgi:hypothetical protein
MAMTSSYYNEIQAKAKFEIPVNNDCLICYQLEDDRRVFSQAAIISLMPYAEQLDNLRQHLAVVNHFLPFFFLSFKMRNPIVFKVDNLILRGIAQQDVETIFTAFLRARSLHRLPRRYLSVAGIAEQYFYRKKTMEQLRLHTDGAKILRYKPTV